MEFLMVSDIHAEEFSKFAKTDPSTGMNTRLQWTLDIFDQILEYGDTHGISTLLIGGDVFDKRGTISVPVYDAVYEKILMLNKKAWDVISIVGNHDQALKSGAIHSLRPLPMHVVDHSASLVGLPGAKMLGCVSFHETPEEFLNSLKRLKTPTVKGAEFYLIHQGVNGAKIAGDEILSRDETDLRDIRKIVGKDAWVFSGHYHIHQQLDDRFYYIGSSTPKDFGDTTPKGFLHFKDGVVTQIESRAPKFIVVDAQTLQKRKKELKGNYIQVQYEGEEPTNIEALGAAGAIVVPKKVERVYDRRSTIDPEHSPMQIIRSYVKDCVEKIPDLNLEEKDLLAALKDIVGTRTLEQYMAGHKIRIDKVSVTNFMSYESETFDLSKMKGLVSIEGENNDDPSAVSNGAGKSVIPEAIKWALYGSTARGLTGDAVVNRTAGKNCSVEIVLVIGENLFKVVRYRKHKELKNQLFFDIYDCSGQNDKGEIGVWNDLRGKSDAETEAKLIKEMGIDENTFNNTVFFGHNFTKSFAALTDKEQKQILETILGVEWTQELLEKAKELSKAAQVDYDAVLAQVTLLEDRKVRDVQTMTALETDFNDWEQNRDERVEEQLSIVAQKNEYVKTMAANDKEESELKELDAKIEGFKATTQKINELDGILEDLAAQREPVQEHLDKLNGDKDHGENELAKYQDTALKYLENAEEYQKSVEHALCPTCSQEVKGESLDEINRKIEALQKNAEAANSVIGEILQKLKPIAKQIAEAEKEIEKIDKKVEKIEGEKTLLQEETGDLATVVFNAHELREKLSSIKSAIKSVNQQITTAKEWAQKFKTEKNPLEAQLEAAIFRVEEGQKLLKIQAALQAEAWTNFGLFKFWENAFSDKGTPTQSPIKSFLFDAIVPVLDELSRVYSEFLTSGSIEVQFNTVTALKSGELRDKFSVDVVNRYGAGDYLGDSGGERRKVDLIIMFALHSLARIRSGSQVNVLFLDEILDSLDAEGCSRVMDLLAQITSEIETIFVITHNENLKTRFSSRLKVVKKGGVSHLAA